MGYFFQGYEVLIFLGEMEVIAEYVWIPGNIKLCCLNKLLGMIRGRKMVIGSTDLQFSKMGQLHVISMHTNI